jgi:hypothetical protein
MPAGGTPDGPISDYSILDASELALPAVFRRQVAQNVHKYLEKPMIVLDQ